MKNNEPVIAAYILTDVRTGKFYVGSSQDVRKRLHRHYGDLRKAIHHCHGLQKLWNVNGLLEETIMPVDTRDEAYLLEQDLLDRFRTSGELLNIGLSVKGGDNLTRHPNRDVIVERIKEAIIDRMHGLTPHQKKLMFGLPGSRNGMWGKTHTSEARKKISEAHLGHSYNKGIKLSPEHCRKISERAKLRVGEKNSFHGKHHSEETRRTLSIQAKARDFKPPNSRVVVINGVEYESLTEASRRINVSAALVLYRLKKIRRHKYPGYYYKDERSTAIESTSLDGDGSE